MYLHAGTILCKSTKYYTVYYTVQFIHNVYNKRVKPFDKTMWTTQHA